MKSFILLIVLSSAIYLTSYAQSLLEKLESVPKEFIERYQQEYHEYNPLHVGDLWQLMNYLGGYNNREIVKDTLVNGKKYFKNLSFNIQSYQTIFIGKGMILPIGHHIG